MTDDRLRLTLQLPDGRGTMLQHPVPTAGALAAGQCAPAPEWEFMLAHTVSTCIASLSHPSYPLLTRLTMKMIERPPAATYDPNRLFDTLLRTMELDSDEALCAALRIPPYLVSSIRCGEASIAPSLLIRINELSGINIRELRCWMGDRRSEYRLGEGGRRVAVSPADAGDCRRYFVETDDPGLPNYVQWT